MVDNEIVKVRTEKVEIDIKDHRCIYKTIRRKIIQIYLIRIDLNIGIERSIGSLVMNSQNTGEINLDISEKIDTKLEK